MNVRARETLASIASTIPGADIATKPAEMWNVYEPHFAPLRDQPLRILELGIHKGVSTLTFAAYFRNADITAIDIDLPDISAPNLTMMKLNQVDVHSLNVISRKPWDIVIDDASHVGHFSLISFNALFPHLKAGGLYIVEDWGASYSPTWGDGAALQPPQPCDVHPNRAFMRQITTHNHGMAGFIKSLVDLSHYPASVFEWLFVHPMTVIARKR